MLDVVDEDNLVIGTESRSSVHQRGLRHRGVHVFLFTKHGMLLVQHRSAHREASPSTLDCSVSEHVQAGEDYLHAAVRGMREELGLEGISLSLLACFSMTYGEKDHKISQLYEGRVQPESVRYDPKEVAAIAYYRLEELLEKLRTGEDKFSLWFQELLRWYCSEPSALKVREQHGPAGWPV
jgi:16S rRNA (adenine1518-N6/adenine1519-N6)-dimethyltransferase